MINDFRLLDNEAAFQCDVCIIGAGAAGIAIACELRHTGLTVYLLETGGLDFDPASQSLTEGECAGLPMRAFEPDRYVTVEAGRARMFGGTTRLWSGLCIPLCPMDLEERPWIPYSGWPLTFEDLQVWYLKACEILGLDPNLCAEVMSERTSHFLPGLDSRYARVALWQWAWIKRFGESFRGELKAALSVRVLLHAHVVRLCTNESGTLVNHVEVRSLAGKIGRVEARTFVLAAGGIENARLLLLSNERCRAGVGNEHDLVGRFFMEHPRGRVLSMRERPQAFDHRWIEGTERFRLGFALGPDIQRQHHVGNCSFYFAASSESGTVELWFDAEQVPNPASRVCLSSERDQFDVSKCRVKWQLNDVDRKTVHTAAAAFLAELRRANLAQIQIDDWVEEIGDDWAFNIHDIFHHMGTTRMADDPSRGVVSKDCQVYGIANLFVAGSSVFPTAGFANPTFTIIALALRLSDHLNRTLRKQQVTSCIRNGPSSV
jgi:choline dehydrogenase-like flavoprotein